MFTNVGMNPYGSGGASVNSQPQTPSSPGDPGKNVQAEARGESAASASRPETVARVDPARQTERARRLPEQERREIKDPDAPAGPPPAFEETPLQRQARVAFQAPEYLSATESNNDTIEPDKDRKHPPDTKALDADRRVTDEALDRKTARRLEAANAFAEGRTASQPVDPPEVNVAR